MEVLLRHYIADVFDNSREAQDMVDRGSLVWIDLKALFKEVVDIHCVLCPYFLVLSSHHLLTSQSHYSKFTIKTIRSNVAFGLGRNGELP